MTRAENSAEELVFDLGLTLPIVPSDVCRELNSTSFHVTYQEKYLNSKKFCGISIGDRTGAEILVNAAIDNRGRKNFTAAHEIGHVLLHIQSGLQSQFECTNDDIYGGNGDNNRVYEKEANEFASSLLMPKSLIGKSISRNDLSWQLVQTIGRDCKTSLEATARRIVRLSKDPCALVIHKNGQMWTPIKASSFSPFIENMPFPDYLKTSPDIIDKDLPDSMLECDASDWLGDRKDLPERIFYRSIRNEEYDRTMTLILISEIDDDDEGEWEEPKFRR